jgi:hypothetical protein
VDNIKMDLREIGWVGMDWIDLAEDRDQWRALVNTVMNRQVSQNVGKFLSNCTTGGFSRRAELHGVSMYLCEWAHTCAHPLWPQQFCETTFSISVCSCLSELMKSGSEA